MEEIVDRETVREAVDELYKEGRLVKVLDADGQPMFRKGQPLFKVDDDATAAELEFWRLEAAARRGEHQLKFEFPA